MKLNAFEDVGTSCPDWLSLNFLKRFPATILIFFILRRKCRLDDKRRRRRKRCSRCHWTRRKSGFLRSAFDKESRWRRPPTRRYRCRYLETFAVHFGYFGYNWMKFCSTWSFSTNRVAFYFLKSLKEEQNLSALVSDDVMVIILLFADFADITWQIRDQRWTASVLLLVSLQKKNFSLFFFSRVHSFWCTVDL